MKYVGSDQAVQQTVAEIDGACAPNITVVDADCRDAVGPGKIVVAKALDNRELVGLALENGARHVVQLPNIDFSRQLIFSAQILGNPDAFFENPFRYLVANGTSSLLAEPLGIFRYRTSDFASKDDILAKIQQDLDQIPRIDNSKTSVLAVSDEMLMNAMKDAPKYFARNFAHLNPEGRTSTLNMAHDGQRLLLWTEDDFGSLSIDKLLGRLRDCYQDDQSTPLNVEGEGAGLGCRIILDLSVALSIFVKPGRKTVFCALLPLGMSHRKQQGLPKNLHILGLSF